MTDSTTRIGRLQYCPVGPVETAETVAVLAPPGNGDDVQMLKASILKIADVFAVNRADMDGATRTVQELKHSAAITSHHGNGVLSRVGEDASDDEGGWVLSATGIVAHTGEGDEFVETLADRRSWLAELADRDCVRRQSDRVPREPLGPRPDDRSVQKFVGNSVAEDFACALVDFVELGVAVEPFGREILGVAVAAVYLDSLVGDFTRDLRRV